MGALAQCQSAFTEPSEYVTDTSPWLSYSQFTACFVPYDGWQVSYPRLFQYAMTDSLMEDSMIQEKLGFELHLDVGCDVAISKVTSALKQEGFGVLTQIDVKQTLKEKLDADFRSYMILGACNPSLAQRALNADLDVGLLLPCNVVVYESGHGSVISIVDPLVMLGVMSNPALKPIAAEAHAKLKRVYESLRI